MLRRPRAQRARPVQGPRSPRSVPKDRTPGRGRDRPGHLHTCHLGARPQRQSVRGAARDGWNRGEDGRAPRGRTRRRWERPRRRPRPGKRTSAAARALSVHGDTDDTGPRGPAALCREGDAEPRPSARLGVTPSRARGHRGSGPLSRWVGVVPSHLGGRRVRAHAEGPSPQRPCPPRAPGPPSRWRPQRLAAAHVPSWVPSGKRSHSQKHLPSLS